jgi:EmrB/QacA subfamily drug resistance transporter
MTIVEFESHRTSMTLEPEEILVTATAETSATARIPAATQPVADPRRWRMLPVILSATFMAMFDFFVVNVAAPSLQHDLRVSDAALEFVVGGYAFTYASGMVTGGRLGDLHGYRRLFLIGMSTFTVASLLCGLAQNADELVAARLLQGLTAAAMVPQVLALISATFPARERAKAFAWFGATIGLGSVAGQVVGGVLLDANLFGLGWRSIFLVNVPIGVLAVVAALRLLPHAQAQNRPRLDIVGAVGLSGSLALALVPLVLGRSEGWPVWTWVSMAASIPVLAAVLRYQSWLGRRGGAPLVDLALFRDRTFVAGMAISSSFLGFFGSFMLALTLLLQAGLGLTPLSAGLAFGPLGLAFAIVSVLARPLGARYGWKLTVFGSLTSAVGLVSMLVVLLSAGSGVSVGELIPSMTLVGIGNGLVLPSLIGNALAGVRPERAGTAAGVLTTTQQFASAAGVAGLGAVFFGMLGGHPGRGDYVNAMAVLTIADLALVLVALAATRLLRPAHLARHAALSADRLVASSSDAAGAPDAVPDLSELEHAGL